MVIPENQRTSIQLMTFENIAANQQMLDDQIMPV